MKQKLILDACCGARMFYFDKNDPNVLFQDIRIVETCIVGKGKNSRKFSVNPETWKEDIKKGFLECFRVLKENWILIFKWNEHDIRLSEILKLSPYNPIFGHPSGKSQKTHWVCFLKIDNKII